MNQVPLAERMRPESLIDYIGQNHLIGEKGILSAGIRNKMIPSLILWGPPGVGKTTLAHLISQELDRPFYTLSAINSGVKDVREVIQNAEKNTLFSGGTPILFIDEIHRFSKSQQDSLLGAVEKGTVTLIGATTENPSFEVISALLSRCQVYVLKHHSKEDLIGLINKANSEDSVISSKNLTLESFDALLAYSGGDARRLLNNFEIVANSVDSGTKITNNLVKDKLSKNPTLYDKGGDQHYDIISAFIKSIRGSDPNGALYWLARMIEGGEDPKFIARRLIIAASEEIGNANPTALQVATDCFKAVEVIGYPECEIILGQATTYLASSPKSNASYLGIKHARTLVKETGALPVPLHLRNAPSKLMKSLDYGKDYKYTHDYPYHFTEQEYLPKSLENIKLFDPANTKIENNLRDYLKFCWKKKYDY